MITEILLGLLIILMITAAILFYIYVLPKFQPPETEVNAVVNEFRSIIHSPTKKGHLGEYIVRYALDSLPKGLVTEKFTHPDLQGIPDFAVKVGELQLIIDSKFTSVEESKYMLKRALETKKYITPGLTYPFVLVWIPEPAWEVLTEKDAVKMLDAGVIPCSTSGLISTVYLVRYALKFFDVEEKYGDIRFWFDKMSGMDRQGFKVINMLGTAQKQLSNGMSNLKKAKAEMESMDFEY